jgi:hypothetical protein
MKIKNRNKKAQQELVGFVMIIILLVVIGIVFLGFSLRQKPEPVEHQESMMLDTMFAILSYSSCETNMRQLIKDCYNEPSKDCDGVLVCSHVNKEFSAMLDSVLGEDIADAFVHGYVLNITAQDQQNTEIMSLEKGNTTGNYFGAEIPIPSSGTDIIFNLRYYYSKI